MNKSILGIDLGTSSVKVLQRYRDGTILKAKARYEAISPDGWWKAICEAMSKVQLQDVDAIGLSSQVGTYIIDDRDVIGWNSGIGTEELTQIKNTYDTDVFLREISMPHPNIVSYPIPRLKYIKAHYPNVKKICQPKDFICRQLTDNCVTDPYSWRGLANLQKKDYSEYFLKELGIEKNMLPQMLDYDNVAGYTKQLILGDRQLKAGVPVYVGLNDYFAGLLGMGVQKAGDMFDVSGTSEHLGILEADMQPKTELVSGPYLNEYVHYGVTASSGASLMYGLQFYDYDEIDMEKVQKNNPPIFLPYLNGERAPIWDADARGMFFGISKDCTKEDMAYAVMEGVAFSLYHIYECMGSPAADMIKTAGGAAVYKNINQIKAELFGIPVAVLEESDTSALGAVMTAYIGIGRCEDLGDLTEDICKIRLIQKPTGKYEKWLERRYQIYRELYPAVKMQYKRMKEIEA